MAIDIDLKYKGELLEKMIDNKIKEMIKPLKYELKMLKWFFQNQGVDLEYEYREQAAIKIQQFYKYCRACPKAYYRFCRIGKIHFNENKGKITCPNCIAVFTPVDIGKDGGSIICPKCETKFHKCGDKYVINISSITCIDCQTRNKQITVTCPSCNTFLIVPELNTSKECPECNQTFIFTIDNLI